MGSTVFIYYDPWNPTARGTMAYGKSTVPILERVKGWVDISQAAKLRREAIPGASTFPPCISVMVPMLAIS